MSSNIYVPVGRSSVPALGRTARVLLAAGLVPLPWFLIWTGLGGAMAPGYSALAQQASELTLRPGAPHVLLDVAALGSGVAFVAFALGLWLESGRRVAFGAVAWLLFGLAMASNGVWTMGSRMHGMYAIGFVVLIAPALSLLETQRLRENKVAFAITVVASFAGVLYLWMSLVGADPHTLRGLTQRIFSSINSLWPATIAFLLLRRTPKEN